MSRNTTFELQNLSQLFFKSSSSQSADVIHLHRGLVSLFKRSGSNQWQCRFKLPNDQWHSMSTGRADLEEAKQSSIALYEQTMAKITQELSLKSKSFKQLAEEDLAAMDIANKEGDGKTIFKDYKFIFNKYLIPFFGKFQLKEITPELVKDFESWRLSQMGRDPQASTKRTHATTYNRVVSLAREQNLIADTFRVPLLDPHGSPSQARPAFSKEEIAQLLAYMPSWEKIGRSSRTKEMRQLCRSYVEFLLYTGARPGTELKPMRWKHLQWHWIGDQRYLKVWLSGKTGPRYLIAKHLVVDCLERLNAWHQLPYKDLDAVIEARLDRLIFSFPRGVQPYNFNPQFENLLKECSLLKDVAGRNRSLYSLRHTYATFALAEGVDIHTLARQMGTSTLMIERHYSKLTPMMAAAKLA
ncbi:site-specific integrase [Polynucleobacter wuianus]|uniref:tyrosine-type recombinase/integrase n=1 Tax=Polynucleobacter wuianus TaxID=1743168 RepID=UPI001C0B7501|nr:site-specific integrase [Polynucleobacter wuianus]MBU3610669.1 site-specific integrase [Polynucleobacter wuianus]